MTAIVAGGLGGGGPIVTGGYGLAGASDPNAMRATITAAGGLQATLSAAGAGTLTATLAGTSMLTASLTDPNVATQASPRKRQAVLPPQPIPGHLSAHLHGASLLTADLIGIDIDAATVLMLLDLDLMLTEGVQL